MFLKEIKKLCEEFFAADKISNYYVEVFKNPSSREYEELESYINYKEVKAIATVKKLFVWGEPEIFHEVIKRKFNIGGTAITINGQLSGESYIVITFPNQSTSYYEEFLLEHPVITKLFDSVEVFDTGIQEVA